MIRVILVDDDLLARSRVGRLLQEAADVRVVGSFARGTEAVRFLARETVHVAVLDLAQGGIDVARRMRAVSPKTQLLMLAGDTRPQRVREAFWAGAAGYVLKEAADGEVVAAVRAVHAGKVPDA